MTSINEFQAREAIRKAFRNPMDQKVDLRHLKDNTSRILDEMTKPVLPYGKRMLQIQIQNQEKG